MVLVKRRLTNLCIKDDINKIKKNNLIALNLIAMDYALSAISSSSVGI